MDDKDIIIKELRDELERERLRLAACGCAAVGILDVDTCSDKYHSASLDDVVGLYKKYVAAVSIDTDDESVTDALKRLETAAILHDQSSDTTAYIDALHIVSDRVCADAKTIERLSEEYHVLEIDHEDLRASEAAVGDKYVEI